MVFGLPDKDPLNQELTMFFFKSIGKLSKFLILPLIHSENISDHIFAHNLCDTYLKSHPQFDNIKKQFDYHTVAIKKFGRYPHRNETLKRSSTKEEKIFLDKPNSSW